MVKFSAIGISYLTRKQILKTFDSENKVQAIHVSPDVQIKNNMVAEDPIVGVSVQHRSLVDSVPKSHFPGSCH